MSTRKIFNYPSDILPELTIEKEGYHPDKLGKTSTKFIWASCRYCGKPSRIRKGFYNNANSACHKECRLKEQSESGSPFKNKSVRDKAKKTIKDRYGVEYASQNANIAQKISKAKTKNSLIPEELLSLGDYKIRDNVIIYPSKEYAIVCHNNDELIHKENNYCLNLTREYANNGLDLFHLYSHLWPNRKKQILNFVSFKIGLSRHRVMGRKCLLGDSICPDFFDSFHIQGRANLVQRYFNLIYNGEVVGSITASKHHRQNVNRNDIVLSRLCFRSDFNVQGGSSKLFKAFKEWAKSAGYTNVISWSDNSWTSGNIYEVLGFKLDCEYPPDYFYWDVENKKYVSKQSQQKKKVNCPAGMTEHEWAKERGLYRTWDCGKKKWIYNLV